MGLVSIVRCRSYKYDNVAKALRKGVRLIGDVTISDKPVLIKPNLCAEHQPSNPERSGNSNIQLVRAIIDFVLEKKKDVSIRIVESNSEAKQVENAFANFGYTQLEEDYRLKGYDVALVNLSEEKNARRGGIYYKRLVIPKILLGPKFLISISKAKTHGLTTITGALKNQFGCLPEAGKAKYHKRIDELIVDLNRIIKTDFCVVDGVVGLEGVEMGNPRKLGVLLCGRNAVEIDTILARIMGFNPSRIRHIALSEKNGLGTTDVEAVGESIESVTLRFERRDVLWKGGLWKYVPSLIYPTVRRLYNYFTLRRRQSF